MFNVSIVPYSRTQSACTMIYVSVWVWFQVSLCPNQMSVSATHLIEVAYCGHLKNRAHPFISSKFDCVESWKIQLSRLFSFVLSCLHACCRLHRMLQTISFCVHQRNARAPTQKRKKSYFFCSPCSVLCPHSNFASSYGIVEIIQMKVGSIQI